MTFVQGLLGYKGRKGLQGLKGDAVRFPWSQVTHCSFTEYSMVGREGRSRNEGDSGVERCKGSHWKTRRRRSLWASRNASELIIKATTKLVSKHFRESPVPLEGKALLESSVQRYIYI